KKKEETIAYYKSQPRDTALVGFWGVDTPAHVAYEKIDYFVFRANGEVMNYAIYINDNRREDYEDAYWYTSETSKQVYIYTPGKHRERFNSEESIARYELVDNNNKLTLEFITGLEEWRLR